MIETLQRITKSKARYRRKLAQLPIEEKLKLLDQLAVRSKSIRKAKPLNRSAAKIQK